MLVSQVYFQDGIDMKKVCCYPKYTYYYPSLLGFVLVCITGFVSFMKFQEDNSTLSRAIWIFIIVASGLTMLFGFFYYRQYLLIENGKFILRNPFIIIKELDINECYYEVSVLPTGVGRGYVNERWICIYSRKIGGKKFIKGISNSKKYNGIQLIYNEENLDVIKKYISK